MSAETERDVQFENQGVPLAHDEQQHEPTSPAQPPSPRPGLLAPPPVRQTSHDGHTPSQGASHRPLPRRPLPSNFPVTPSPPYRQYDRTAQAPQESYELSPAGLSALQLTTDVEPNSERIPQSPSQKRRFDPDHSGLGYTTEQYNPHPRSPSASPQPETSDLPYQGSMTEKRLPRFDDDLPGLGFVEEVVPISSLASIGHYRHHSSGSHSHHSGGSPRFVPIDEPFDPHYLQPVGRTSRHEPMPSTSSTVVPHEMSELYSGYAGLSRTRSNGEYSDQYHDTRPINMNFNVTMDVPVLEARDPGEKLSEERMTALAEVDHAKLSWFHVRVVLIAGVGFFTDAYDIFSINIAASMLQFVYVDSLHITKFNAGALKAAAPIGTLVGQLVFGYLADHIGRKRMYGIELIIILIGTFGQVLSANSDVGTVSIFATLFIWRLIMGLGIGGDYPLSAVIASEFASKHIRGRMMTAVFANQGWGQFAATVVGAVTVAAFKANFTNPSALYTDQALVQDIDRAWRILIGLGCVPAAIALWFRLTIPETPRFTMDIERNVKQATDDIDRFLSTGGYKYDPDSIVVRVVAPTATFSDFIDHFMIWDNLKVLLGCAYSWFAIDVVFYGLGLNIDKFFSTIGIGYISPPPSGQRASTIFAEFSSLCSANMLLTGVGLIPGYWATFLLVDYKFKWRNGQTYQLGRKGIQLMGFAVLTVLFLAMGASHDALATDGSEKSVNDLTRKERIFLLLLILASFFENFGPNTTTFIIPGEIFPTRYRSTCHGLCAACGKIGAIISQFAFQHVSPRRILFSYVAFTVTGLLATLLINETSQRTLEELSNEEQSHFIEGPVRPDGNSTALAYVFPGNVPARQPVNH